MYDVGGVAMERPFQIRRLGHFGVNAVAMAESLHFYRDLLGFRVSDWIDLGRRSADPGALADLGDPKGYFMRLGTDHHTFVLFNKRVREAVDRQRRFRPGVTVNQISWQVGSLTEVVQGEKWLREEGLEIQRTGRDMPGSNWHTYLYDPEGHTNELFYGMEQVGWNGYSKPEVMHARAFHEPPPLPQASEQDEVSEALAQGVDLCSGLRAVNPPGGPRFEVDGIWMERPFKAVAIGPIGLFVENQAAALDFYQRRLGFICTETVAYYDQVCYFLRCNGDHHTVALYPLALREVLGFSPHTTLMAMGLKIATYRQLKDAREFLLKAGVPIIETVPARLHPGVAQGFYALDPDGHAVFLYFQMDQIGWQGQPRPFAEESSPWPTTVESDGGRAYMGSPFLGPWE